MTFSILIHDRETGAFGAAAATGSLCVGGWVLRGDVDAGLVASQGTAPSTFWRDDALRLMYAGQPADRVVAGLTDADGGRAHRQLIAMDATGGTGGFTGADSVAHAAHRCAPGLAVAGNMLAGPAVLSALDAAGHAAGPLPARLLDALAAAQAAGGDSRGLMSAALLVLRPDRPPLDLRVDHADDPVAALRVLNDRAHAAPYHDWLAEVPVAQDRSRAPRVSSSDP